MLKLWCWLSFLFQLYFFFHRSQMSKRNQSFVTRVQITHELLIILCFDLHPFFIIVSFPAKMPNICMFQLLKCPPLFLLHKFNIRYKTKSNEAFPPMFFQPFSDIFYKTMNQLIKNMIGYHLV